MLELFNLLKWVLLDVFRSRRSLGAEVTHFASSCHHEPLSRSALRGRKCVSSERALVDELNDPTGARLDQHGAAVHDRVVVAPRAAIFGRNVVIADSSLGQDRTNCEGLRIRVRRHLLTNNIFAEPRSISDAQNAGNPASHTANHSTDDSTERTRSLAPFSRASRCAARNALRMD